MRHNPRFSSSFDHGNLNFSNIIFHKNPAELTDFFTGRHDIIDQ
jgi:hypothetical protein